MESLVGKATATAAAGVVDTLPSRTHAPPAGNSAKEEFSGHTQ